MLTVATVQDDAAADTLFGDGGLDWFFARRTGPNSDTVKNWTSGEVLTSLFIMEFAPGGTNFPHHHDQEEEIYLVLDGSGEMVAGGGADGIEGRHPARTGDAYFFRLNCTVGFSSARDTGTKARILAVRSRYPFSTVMD